MNVVCWLVYCRPSSNCLVSFSIGCILQRLVFGCVWGRTAGQFVHQKDGMDTDCGTVCSWCVNTEISFAWFHCLVFSIWFPVIPVVCAFFFFFVTVGDSGQSTIGALIEFCAIPMRVLYDKASSLLLTHNLDIILCAYSWSVWVAEHQYHPIDLITHHSFIHYTLCLE